MEAVFLHLVKVIFTVTIFKGNFCPLFVDNADALVVL